MPSQPKNTFYTFLDNPSDVVTVPLDQTGSGTISTQGVKLIGAGTAFKTTLAAGAWIFNGTDEVRRVILVIDNTNAVLEAEFSSNITGGSDFKYISSLDAMAREISIMIPVTEDDLTTQNSWGTLDGQPLPSGAPANFSKTNRDNSSRPDFVDPVVLDVTGTQAMIGIQYQ